MSAPARRGLLRQAWDYVFPPIGQLVADISYQPRPVDLPPGMPNISTGAGPEVRNFSTWQPWGEMLALRQPSVWRGINLIVGTLASLPQHAYIDLHRVEPTPTLLQEPSPTWTRSEVWRALLTDYLLWGNLVGHLSDWDEWARPQRIRPLPADQVSAVVADGEIVSYVYHDRPIAPREILHLRWFTRPGRAFGYGILEVMARALGLMDQLGDHAHKHFQGSGIPSIVLNVDRDSVTSEQAQELKGDWLAGQRTRSPAVVPRLVKVQEISGTPDQSQLLQSREFSAVEAEFMLNLPPGMLGGGGAGGGRITYQNIESLDRIFHDQTLLPIITTIEQRLTGLLPPPEYAKWEVDGLLRGSTLNRFAVYKIGIETGITTRDEARALEDRPPLDEEEPQGEEL